MNNRRGKKHRFPVAPIDRFTWKDGDVVICYDPSKDPNAKSDTEKRAERRARGEVLESDLRGANRDRRTPDADEPVRFRNRKRRE